jgi:hypothetical protein
MACGNYLGKLLMLHSLEICVGEHREQTRLEQVFCVLTLPKTCTYHFNCNSLYWLIHSLCFCIFLKYILESSLFLPLYLWQFEQAKYM